jgi:hypothetical protein
MAYSRRLGRRPMEQASKTAHSHVINDPAVQAFIGRCARPKTADEVQLDAHTLVDVAPVSPNPIRHVVAVDSGFTEVAVDSSFPSSTLGFFQFGILTFSISDLEGLGQLRFIDPDDMAKLKQIERLKLALPLRNIALADHGSLVASVRRALHEFFAQARDGTSLLETLKWFVFEEYGAPSPHYDLASCPVCLHPGVKLLRAAVLPDGCVPCSSCGTPLYLTDVFRLHEAIDEEMGAGGVMGYVTTLLEQILLVHFVRLVLKHRPALLSEVLLIKDGPLAFFGQTANMHRKMRSLVRFLLDHHGLYLAGLEKSGAFVDHAAELASVLPAGKALLLDNDYIYRYIIPGKADPANPYGGTTYYSSKLIFKSSHSRVYVATLPTREPLLKPTPADLPNLQAVLSNIEKLHCDMYDDALLPVALVNKLVSLSNHPSAKILQRFAVDAVQPG